MVPVSTSPRAVIFDFGGVLWDMRWDVARDLDRTHGLPRSSVFETLYRCSAWGEIECGIGDPAVWTDGDVNYDGTLTTAVDTGLR